MNRKSIISLVAATAFILLGAYPALAGSVTVSPTEGSVLAWLGTVDFDNDNDNDFTGASGTGVWNNWLSFNVGTDASFSLDYNFFTWDYYPYDEPGFAIYDGAYNDPGSTLLLQWYAEDIDDSSVFGLEWTDWQTYFGASSTGTIYIYAGNTGDEGVQSWVFLDNLVVGLTGGGLDSPGYGFDNESAASDVYGFENGLADWGYGGQAGTTGEFTAEFPDPQEEPNMVPLPGAVWLLASGLFGLAGLRRKFNK